MMRKLDKGKQADPKDSFPKGMPLAWKGIPLG